MQVLKEELKHALYKLHIAIIDIFTFQFWLLGIFKKKNKSSYIFPAGAYGCLAGIHALFRRIVPHIARGVSFIAAGRHSFAAVPTQETGFSETL